MAKKITSSNPVETTGSETSVNNKLFGTNVKKYEPKTAVDYQAEMYQDKTRAAFETPAYIPGNVEDYSQYDTGMPYGYEGGVNEWRGQQQTTAGKWGNALPKFVGKAVSTFGETFTAPLVGLPTAIAEGRASGIYDNAFGSIWDSMNGWIEKSFPHYYTKEEQERAFYENLGTANFWADKFFANMGFTVGAYAGALATAGIGSSLTGIGNSARFLNAAAKSAQANKFIQYGEDATKIANTIMKDARKLAWTDKGIQATSLYMAAQAESAIEARGNYNALKESMIKQYTLENGMEPQGEALQNIENLAHKSGNVAFAINMPLLMISDAVQFGAALGRGYSKDLLAVNKILEKEGLKYGDILTKEGGRSISDAGKRELFDAFANKTFQAAKLTGADKTALWGKSLLQSPLREGIYEEMGQFAIEKGTQDYYDRMYNKKNTDVVKDIIESIGVGMSESYGTDEGWEQGFIGGITGMLGLPGFSRKTSDETGEVKRTFQMQGGVWNNPVAAKRAQDAKVVELLNKDDQLEKLYRNAVNYVSAQSRYDDAIGIGDKFEAENAKFQDFVSMVDTYNQLGMKDLLKERLDSFQTASAQEFETLFGYKPGEVSTKDIADKTHNLLKQVDRISAISNAIDTRYRGINNDYRSMLINTAAFVENSEARLDNVIKEIGDKTKGRINTAELKDIKSAPFTMNELTKWQVNGLAEFNKIASKQEYSTEDEIRLNEIGKDLGFTKEFIEKQKVKKSAIEVDKYQKAAIDSQLDKQDEIFEEWKKSTGGIEADEVRTLLNDSVRLIKQKQHYTDLYNALNMPDGAAKFEAMLGNLVNHEEATGVSPIKTEATTTTPEAPTPEAKTGTTTTTPTQTTTPKGLTKEQRTKKRKAVISKYLDLVDEDGEITFPGKKMKAVEEGRKEVYEYVKNADEINYDELRDKLNKLREIDDYLKTMTKGGLKGVDLVEHIIKLLQELDTVNVEGVAKDTSVHDGNKGKTNNDTVEKPVTKSDPYNEVDIVEYGIKNKRTNRIDYISKDTVPDMLDTMRKGYSHLYFLEKVNRIAEIKDIEQRNKAIEELMKEYNQEIAKFNVWLSDFKATVEKPARVKYFNSNNGSDIGFFPIDKNGVELFKYPMRIRRITNSQLKNASQEDIDRLTQFRKSINDALAQGIEVIGEINSKSSGDLIFEKDPSIRIPVQDSVPNIGDNPQIGFADSAGTVHGENGEILAVINKPADNVGKTFLMIESLNGKMMPLAVYSKKIDDNLANFILDIYLLASRLKNGTKTALLSEDANKFREMYGIEVSDETVTLQDLLDLVIFNGQKTLDKENKLHAHVSGNVLVIETKKETKKFVLNNLSDVNFVNTNVRPWFMAQLKDYGFFNYEFNLGVVQNGKMRFDIEIGKDINLSFKKGKSYAAEQIKNKLITCTVAPIQEYSILNKDGKVEKKQVKPFSKPTIKVSFNLNNAKPNEGKQISVTNNVVEPKDDLTDVAPMPDDAGTYMRTDGVATENETTFEQEQKAIEKILGPTNVKEVEGLIQTTDNKMAFGQMFEDAILLSNVGAQGRGYHEAYHRVSLMMLSEKQRNDIYNEARKNGYKGTDKEIEEQLAEKFREYSITKDSRSIGQKILDWFKRLFKVINIFSSVKESEVDILFDRIYRGAYKGVEVLEENKGKVDSYYMVANTPFSIRQLKQIAKDLGTYAIVKQEVNDISSYRLNMSIIDKRVNEHLLHSQSEFERLKNSEKAKNAESLVQLYTDIKNNMPVVKEFIQHFLNQYKIGSDEFLREDDLNEFGESQAYVEAELRYQGKNSATPHMRFILDTLPKVIVTGKIMPNGTKETKLIYNKFSNSPAFEDGKKIHAILYQNIANKRTYDDMYAELTKLSDKYPVLIKLQERLTKSNDIVRGQFFNTFSKARHYYINALFNKNTKLVQAGENEYIETTEYGISVIDADTRQNVLIHKAKAREAWKSSKVFESGTFSMPGLKQMKDAITNSYTEIRELLKSTDVNTPESKTAIMKGLRNILSQVGIDVNNKAIIAVINQQKGEDWIAKTSSLNQVLYTLLVSSGKSYFTELAGKKALMASPIDKIGILGQFINEVAADNLIESEMIPSKKGSRQYRNRPRTFMDDQTDDLNDNFNNIIEGLEATPYNEHSLILDHLRRGGKLKLRTINTVGEAGAFSNNKAYREFVGKDDYLLKMALLMSGNILPPTMSSASTYRVIDGVELPAYELVDMGRGLQFSSSAKATMYNYFLDEYNSIQQAYNQIFKDGKVRDDIDSIDLTLNYHYKLDKNGNKDFKAGNAFKFTNIFSGLNNGTIFKEDGSLKELEGISTSVHSLINKTLNTRLSAELSTMVDMGIISKKGTTYSNVLLPEVMLDSRLHKTTSDKIESLVANILMRNIISTIETSKVYSGSFAFYADAQDVTKRLVELRSPRETSASKTNEDTIATFKFAVANEMIIGDKAVAKELRPHMVAHYVKYLFETNDRRSGMKLDSSEYFSLPEAQQAYVNKVVDEFMGNSFGKNKVADAAVFITPKRAKQLYKEYLADWDEAKEKYFDQLAAGTLDMSITENQEFFQFAIQPLKDVYYGLHNMNNNSVPIFNKMAKFILWPSIYNGTEFEKLMKYMDANGIDEIGSPSAVKVGATNVADVYEVSEDDKITIGDLSKLKPVTLYQRYNGRQLQIPTKDSLKMKLGPQPQRQVKANIIKGATYKLNGKNISGSELMDAMNAVRSTLSNQSKERFDKKMGIKDGIITNPKKFAKKMTSVLLKSNLELNTIKSLVDSKGDLLPIDLLPNAKYTTEKALIGLVKKTNVDLNVTGRALVQAPAVSLKKDLKMVTNGKRIYAEAKASVSLYKNIIPNYKDKTFAEKVAWLERNKDVVTGIGYYTPTQSTTSIIPIKVAGFIEEQFGNLVYLPQSITTFTGKDFDIDELFLMNYNFTYNPIFKKVQKVKYLEPKVGESEESFLNRVYDERIEQVKESYKIVDEYFKKLDVAVHTDELLHVFSSFNALSFTPLSDMEMDDVIDEIGLDKMKYREALDELNKVPTREEFIAQHKGTKDFTQFNSKAANENLYFDTWMSIFESDNHYLQNTMPLDHTTNYLKGIRSQILAHNKVDLEMDMMELGSLAYQVKKKEENMLGKMQGISTASLASSFLPIAQEVGLVFNGVLPNTNTVEIDGEEHTSLHDIYNQDGQFITNIILGIQNGFVDIEKDTWIMDLGLNQYTLKTSLFLTQAGVGERLWWALNSPALRQLSKYYNNSIIDGTNWPQPYQPAIYEMSIKLHQMVDAYNKVSKEKMAPIVISDLQGEIPSVEELKKVSFTVQEEKVWDAKVSKGALSKAEMKEAIDKYIAQIKIMKEWNRLDGFSNNYKDGFWSIIYNSRSDNTNFGATITEVNQFLARSSKPFFTNKAFFTSKNNELGGLTKIFTDTYLGTLRTNGPKYISNLFKNLSIKSKQNYQNAIDGFINENNLNENAHAKINELRENISNMLFGSLISKYLISTHGYTSDKIKSMLFGNESLANRLIQLQAGETNSLLDYFKAVVNDNIKDTPSFVYVEKLDRSDVDTKDDISGDWLRMYRDEKTSQFAKDLAIYAMLQSGYNVDSRGSLLDLVPVEILMDLDLHTYLRSVSESETFEEHFEGMLKHMWSETSIVPNVIVKSGDRFISEWIGEKEHYQVIGLQRASLKRNGQYRPYVKMTDKQGNVSMFQYIGYTQEGKKEYAAYGRVDKLGYDTQLFEYNEYGLDESIFDRNKVENKYMTDANAYTMIREKEGFEDIIFNDTLDEVTEDATVSESVIADMGDLSSIDGIVDENGVSSSKMLEPGTYVSNDEVVVVEKVFNGKVSDMDEADAKKWWSNLLSGNETFLKKYSTPADFLKDFNTFGRDSIEGIPEVLTDELISKMNNGINIAIGTERKQVELASGKLFNPSLPKINIYAGTNENADLSNFADRPFKLGDGNTYPTVEHAFQLQKLEDSRGIYNEKQKQELFDGMMKMSAAGVKSAGARIRGLDIKDWDKRSSDIMEDIIINSFEQNPNALKRLLSTGDAELTHTQDKGKWGKEFPTILMKVRNRFKNIAVGVEKKESTQPIQLDLFEASQNITQEQINNKKKNC